MTIYERRFQRLIDVGEGLPFAAEHVALAYLDSKPTQKGKLLSSAERHAAFWSCSFLTNLPAQAWQSQAMMLALAQYMGQERVASMSSSPTWLRLRLMYWYALCDVPA